MGTKIQTILFYNHWQPIYSDWVSAGLVAHTHQGVPHIDEFKTLCTYYTLENGISVVFVDFEKFWFFWTNIFLVLHNLFEKDLQKISLNSNRIILTNNSRDVSQIEPKWKVEEWNIYEKIIKKEETSTCKLEAWHKNLDNILLKPHPSLEDSCRVLMGVWVKIDYVMDHLESGITVDKIKFKTSSSEKNRQERIFNVAMNVNNFHTIVDYLNPMAVASKK
jgi:hypothetical protein